jgi:hypothetical protein
MDGLVCDACGGGLLLDDDVRYILKVEGYAAYDPLELTRNDLARDLEAEMRSILEALSRLSPEEAQDQVHRSFRFDLCPGCWRRYLKDPLAGLKPSAERRTPPTSEGANSGDADGEKETPKGRGNLESGDKEKGDGEDEAGRR